MTNPTECPGCGILWFAGEKHFCIGKPKGHEKWGSSIVPDKEIEAMPGMEPVCPGCGENVDWGKSHITGGIYHNPAMAPMAPCPGKPMNEIKVVGCFAYPGRCPFNRDGICKHPNIPKVHSVILDPSSSFAPTWCPLDPENEGGGPITIRLLEK